MKKTDKALFVAVSLELDELLENSRAGEVILKKWYEDRSLPTPSPELLEFFAMDLLWGDRKFERFKIAGISGIDEAIRTYVIELKQLCPKARQKVVTLALVRRMLIGWIEVDSKVVHWSAVLSAGTPGVSESSVIGLGERRTIQLLTELMALRAIEHKDSSRLGGLLEAVGRKRGISRAKQEKSKEIAFHILAWGPYLAMKLGRDPSKTEMQTFLQGVYPGLSSSPTNWAEAWKLGVWRTASSGRKIDSHQITKLALHAREEGPKIKRTPKWRIPPTRRAGEDLQK